MLMDEVSTPTPDPTTAPAPQKKFSPKLLLLIGGLAILLLSAVFMILSSPEKELIGHIKAADKIMRENMNDPEKGVDELIKYFEKHGPDAAKAFVELGIELSRIEGDGDLEDRLERIRNRLKTPWKNIDGTAEKFGKKVEEDEDLMERIEEYGERWEALNEAFEELDTVIN